MSPFDLFVVGAGAAGLTAAREGARLGARVALAHDGPLGGECTWTGCIPSKALLAAAAEGASFADAQARVQAAVRRVAATEDAAVLAAEGIAVLPGRATLLAPDRLEVDGRRYSARRVVVATGSTPAVPPIDGLEAAAPLTNETVFTLATAPRRLVVLGGGAIGCELAQAYARLGVAVTVLEAQPRLLSREEPEAAAVIVEALRADGVEVRLGVAVDAVERRPDGTRGVHVGGDVVVADQVLVAAGRRPTTGGFGLEAAGVAVDESGHIVVDDTMATSVPGVFAAGDVTGRMLFTHAAGRMAWVATHNALERRPSPLARRFRTAAVPWATFTAPEVGRVGCTEAEAAARGPARVAWLPLAELDRALATGLTAGFVKLVAAPRPLTRRRGGGRIVGATIVAPVGGEMIHEVALAMATRMFAGRLAQATHAYPTWSMAVQLAALQLVDATGGRPARRAPAAASAATAREAETPGPVGAGAGR